MPRAVPRPKHPRSRAKQPPRAPADRLRFETLLLELSAAFVKASASDVDREIEGWLKRIVEFLGIDRSTIAQFSDDEGDFRITHSWVRPGLTPVPSIIAREALPWLREQMLKGRVVSSRGSTTFLQRRGATRRSFAASGPSRTSRFLWWLPGQPLGRSGSVPCAGSGGGPRPWSNGYSSWPGFSPTR